MLAQVDSAYRASDGTDFLFRFMQRPSGWHVHLRRVPDYRGRSTMPRMSHLYRLAGMPPWVCWSEHIADLRAACEVAALWAEATVAYISTGRFDGSDRPEVAVDADSAVAAALSR